MLDPTWYIFRLYISLPRADPICARSLRKQELLNGLNRKEPCGSVSFQRIFLLFCRPTYFCDHTSQAGRGHFDPRKFSVFGSWKFRLYYPHEATILLCASNHCIKTVINCLEAILVSRSCLHIMGRECDILTVSSPRASLCLLSVVEEPI